MKIKNNVLTIEPCISKEWKEYEIRFKYIDSVYNIKVSNPNGKCKGVEKVIINGEEVENSILLDGSGKVFNIEVIM